MLRHGVLSRCSQSAAPAQHAIRGPAPLYQPPSRYIKIVIELMKIRDVKNRSENYLLDIVGMGSMNPFDWCNCHNFPMKPTAVAVVWKCDLV